MIIIQTQEMAATQAVQSRMDGIAPIPYLLQVFVMKYVEIVKLLAASIAMTVIWTIPLNADLIVLMQLEVSIVKAVVLQLLQLVKKYVLTEP